MKKIISILVSVIMILTALPVFADGETTVAPATIDLYASIEDFDAAELAATYTESAPYSEVGFTVPYGANSITSKAIEDEEIGDFIRTSYINETSGTPNGGVMIKDDNLNLGYGSSHNNVFTHSVTIRRQINQNVWWYLLDSNGERTTLMRWWGADSHRRLYWGSQTATTGINLMEDIWYTVSLSVDFANGKYIVNVDGGAYDNHKYEGTIASALANESKTFVGVGVGYLSAVQKGYSFDVADMSLSNTWSDFNIYDDNLTFEEGTLTDYTTAWTQDNWSISKSYFDNWSGYLSMPHMDGLHKSALKLTSGGKDHFYLNYDIPEDKLTDEDALIIEGSWYENAYSQFNIDVTGDAGTVYPIKYASSSSWNISCMDVATDDNGNTMKMPAKLNDWVRARVILDLGSDKVILQYWKESDPQGSLVTATREGTLESFTNLTGISFRLYTRFGGHQCVDNFRVYKKADSLRFVKTTPVNGEGLSVSEKINPSVIFNAPIASSTATTENVYLLDSDGNKVAGTVGLNYQRNGVAFYPAEDLEADAAYTFVANCEVTDEFGSSLAVNKTIKFETSPALNLVDFKFIQNDVEVEAVAAGDLVAEIQLKSRAHELRNIYAAIAIYNKVTNELVSIDTDSINAVTKTFELTANVPDDGNAYYAKAFVWNTDAVAAPYFAAETLGFND